MPSEVPDTQSTTEIARPHRALRERLRDGRHLDTQVFTEQTHIRAALRDVRPQRRAVGGRGVSLRFGFVPSTRAEDGDPLDVLVLMDAPAFPGCIVPPRLVGVIEAEQTEDGKTERNDRLLAVAANSAAHRSIHELRDLSPDLVAQIEHFFVSYNEMKGNQFKVKGRAGKRRALTQVTAALTKGGRR
jgi:inorganic pyrophosphatase